MMIVSPLKIAGISLNNFRFEVKTLHKVSVTDVTGTFVQMHEGD